MIRIIGGTNKGRLLRVPRGGEVRPTTDRAREALFNVLGAKTGGAEVLDLFCGSGAVGLEALSRGATACVFVDRSRQCIRIAAGNAEDLGVSGQARFLSRDAAAAVAFLAKAKEKFDLIFLDPPYYRDLAIKILHELSVRDILKRKGLVVVEHHQKDGMPNAAGSLVLWRQLRYGDTVLSFFARGESPPEGWGRT